ncbi:YqaJ-like recombinase domain-containing protein [Paraburkholderia fungorum]|uniref:YqaJ-like recombinase domain-containing protein n=1 Tax=Paraburkholderia fungorum TaxID=134537 RepID=A0A1H1IHB1_9BURK|nr:lambda exonuclease family protein [Paraburkholderia fungorum]SDR37127.1 YqaJ-like recombinase domain-containing protein [Paraburkholderia fungorum]
MKIIECAQGSREWLQSRAGCITASMFATARKKVGDLDDRQKQFVALRLAGTPEKAAAEAAGYKVTPKSDIINRALNGEKVGDYSDAAKDYAFRLAIERISGEPLDEGFETWSMRRGHDLEPEARMEHEAKTGLFVKRAGFVTTDDGLFGASADGLINEDGGSEYKCFVAPDKLRAILLDNDFTEVLEQAQGCLWLTGRKWWHIGLYCPALSPVGKQFTMVEVQRDDNFIEAMEKDLWQFAMLVAQYEKQLRQQAA